MRTANPALSAKTFKDLIETAPRGATTTGAMTIQGTVNRTGILLLLIIAAASWPWRIYFTSTNPAAVMPWMIGGLIGGLIIGLVTTFKKTWAPVSAPFYAVCEGFVLGGISAILEQRFPGIVVQAVGLTFGTMAALLFAYKSGLIKATENFKLGVVAATGAVALVYLASFILGMFGVQMPFLHSTGWVGIGISVVIVVIAALNLVLDFDFIEQGAAQGAPKYMEWYSAFGLVVTLVWLYIEILRLLSLLAARRD